MKSLLITILAAYETDLPKVDATSTQLHQVLQIVFGIVGALSLVFVAIGGLRFVLSEGDPQSAGKARSTVLYAVIGLAISAIAEGIVTFVLNRL